MLTVKQLIEQLSKYDPEMSVRVQASDSTHRHDVSDAGICDMLHDEDSVFIVAAQGIYCRTIPMTLEEYNSFSRLIEAKEYN